jgi:tRNA pseudouridine38-40 synthase
MNFRLLIQFDGTDFHGWQVQDNLRTVQGDLERVLTLLNGEEPVHVSGSGRTDAGVHAEGFVANVKINRAFTPERLLKAINGNLWADLRILQVEKAPDDFHARFSAKGKTYLYRVVNAPVISPFWARYALHEARPLDVGRMNQAARLFLGTHDWTAFSAANAEVEHRVRTVTELTVESIWDRRANAAIIEFRITGEGFLRYMVRSIVGTLLEVGRGEKDFDTIQTAIIGGNRNLAGATAPAHGLTLLQVHYK